MRLRGLFGSLETGTSSFFSFFFFEDSQTGGYSCGVIRLMEAKNSALCLNRRGRRRLFQVATCAKKERKKKSQDNEALVKYFTSSPAFSSWRREDLRITTTPAVSATSRLPFGRFRLAVE